MAPSDPATPPIAAIILAAGQGTRMQSRLHKVLHPIGGRPMLLNLLAALAPLAPRRTIVVTGDKAEQIERALSGRAIETARQSPQQGTGHATLVGADKLGAFPGTVLVLFGDVPLVRTATMQRLVDAVAGDGEGAPAIAVLGFRPADPKSYGRIFADDKGMIRRMVEAKDATSGELQQPLCNSGLMAVRGAQLAPLLRAIGNDNAAGEYYLPDIVMAARRRGLAAIVLEGDAAEVAGVNSRAELAAAEALFQQRRRAELLERGVTLVAPETVFLAADTAIGRDTVVEPFVTFGPGVTVGESARIRSFSHLEGATIEDAVEIGPFARLRPGAVLKEDSKVGNFVEIKNTILGEGAKANHLTYLGDADVGARANIGAGTITCNYDGFGKYRTTIGEGAFIGSNSALVAPVAIGDRAIVGAGSVVTHYVEPDALMLVRAPATEKSGWAARFRAQKQKKEQH